MQSIHRYMEVGGPLMWPLLVFSIVLGAVLFERFWVVGVRHALFGAKLDQRKLTAHRRVLPFFKDVPPGVGLLGTVVGVVQSFQLVNGRLDGDSVGSGLGVACLTTVFGLSIAIVASMMQYMADWMIKDELPVAEVKS